MAMLSVSVAYGQHKINALVKVGDAETLEKHGAEVIAQWGDIYVIGVDETELGMLKKEESVKRVEARHRFMQLHNDTTRQLLGVDKVQGAGCRVQGYTGKGVIVGVQDVGFDFTHPTFGGRVTRFWDMIEGRQYEGSDSIQKLGCSKDGTIETHGTHTAGTAAGNGYGGKYVGMAPESEIVMVCNACSNNVYLMDSVARANYTVANDLLGFKYILDYAESQGKPCVINFSEGQMQDPYHDQLYYEALERMTGPGKIIVASAGNQNTARRYHYKDRDTLEACVHTTELGNYLGYYVQADEPVLTNSITIGDTTLTWTTADMTAMPDSMLRDTIVLKDKPYAVCRCVYPDCYGTGRTIYEFTAQNLDGSINVMIPKIRFTGECEAEFFAITGVVADEQEGEYGHNVHFPASAPAVIAVGASGYRDYIINYEGKRKQYQLERDGIISDYSSRGPTMDHRMKPEITAPGNNLISAYSSYYFEDGRHPSEVSWTVEFTEQDGRNYPWTANSGTSMSAPVVTGIIALWLEANPNLSPDDIRDVFAHTARHTDASLTYPNNTYGYGEIDALEGMRYIQEMQGISYVENGGNGENGGNVENGGNGGNCYDLTGRRIANSQQPTANSQSIPSGLYIIGGKKYFVR